MVGGGLWKGTCFHRGGERESVPGSESRGHD